MKKQHLILLGLLVVMCGLVVWNTDRIANPQTQRTVATNPQLATPKPPPGCIPTFADGGGPYYQENVPFREDIAPEINDGEKLIVSGKILLNDCKTPLPGAILDIWQANESGSYDDEWYRGKVTAQEDGSYTFASVLPKGYGEGTGYRPPHIHFKVFEGDRELIISQMFLPAARTQQIEEAYIVNLVTQEEDGETVHYASHDIILP